MDLNQGVGAGGLLKRGPWGVPGLAIFPWRAMPVSKHLHPSIDPVLRVLHLSVSGVGDGSSQTFNLPILAPGT